VEIGWPAELVLIRHGESAGNVAREAALATGAETIDVNARDCDVPLSALGERQAEALGRWWSRNVRPYDALLCSPYVRARQTAEIALRAAGWDGVPVLVDERLREKEFGAFNRLTHAGIVQRYPEQVELRRVLGKFYYRPPGGESWTDVILRVRGAFETIAREHARQRIAMVAHQVVVLCSRYVLERLSEAELLAVDREGDVANCSETTYRLDRATERLALQSYNVVAPLEEEGTPVTAHPDGPVAAT
jgi:broad specificity phosphatase PhoE